MERVSWFDALEFCNALSQKAGLRPFYAIKGQSVEVLDWNAPGYRLPTEAEWEYACRAGTTTRYSFADSQNELGQYAWYSGNSNSHAHAVGKKKANAFGLHDMHGNVWEWCWDGFKVQYYNCSPDTNPRGPDQAVARMFRGGGWNSLWKILRSANRGREKPESRANNVRFRVARVQSSH